jgi:hypothetical protein
MKTTTKAPKAPKQTTKITVTLTIEGSAAKARRAIKETLDEALDIFEDADEGESFDIVEAKVAS